MRRAAGSTLLVLKTILACFCCADQAPRPSMHPIPTVDTLPLDPDSPVVLSASLSADLFPTLREHDWSAATVTELMSTGDSSSRSVRMDESRFGLMFKYFGRSR